MSILAPEQEAVRHALLHERLADGPYWLARLLGDKRPEDMTDMQVALVRYAITTYAQEASEDPGVQPIIQRFEEHLHQQFEDWRHHITRARYQDYLSTDGWERTRLKVLDRAKGICEGCGEARATQVHHLHHEDARGEEMLFNLVAVCRDCHETITRQQKERSGG